MMRWLPALLLLVAAPLEAQNTTPAYCDSVIATAIVDQVPSGLYLSVRRSDGELDPRQLDRLQQNIGAAFDAPRPFKLNVFSGPTLLRGLRSISADTAGVLRSPTLSGSYRMWVTRRNEVPNILVTREAMMQGFDRAAIDALTAVAAMRDLIALPEGVDSMRLDVSFATDSTPGAVRLAAASFPRMRVVDAMAKPNNPLPLMPEGVNADSVGAVSVILRFVVNRDGSPEIGTVEVLRAPAFEFLQAALGVIGRQRFSPATIRGCPISQVVQYPLAFAPRNP